MATRNGVNAKATRLTPGWSLLPRFLYLHRQSSPPRIVWVPTGDTFGPPSQRGNSRADSIARQTARTPVDVHLWGADWDATIALRDLFLQALRTFAGPNYHPSAGRWVGSEDLESKGKLYVLSVSFDIPVTDVAISSSTGLVVIKTEDQSDAKLGA